MARDFAVGASAHAAETNTELAKEKLAQDSYRWVIDWYLRNQALCIAVIVSISVLPALLASRCYRADSDSDDQEHSNPDKARRQK